MRRATIAAAAALTFAAVYQLAPARAPADAETALLPAPVYYPVCADARAAGAAPIYRGQPGYREALDRDRDGIACEPYPRRRRW
jgi:hypothetical protein